MAETTYPPGGGEPTRRTPAFARAWQRISPSLVPIFAVLTALIITVPFMVLTGAEGDFQRGVNIAGTAYSALLEGSLGVTINDRVSVDDLDLVLPLASEQPLTQDTLRDISRGLGDVAGIGLERARRYAVIVNALPEDADDEQVAALAESLPDLAAVGQARLAAMTPLINALSELSRRDVRALAEDYAGTEALTDEQRAELDETLPVYSEYDEAAFLEYMGVVSEIGIVGLENLLAAQTALTDLGIDPLTDEGELTPEAQDLTELTTLPGGISAARRVAAAYNLIDTANVLDPAALSAQIDTVREFYANRLLTDQNVSQALTGGELEAALDNNIVIARPGNRLLIDEGTNVTGAIEDSDGYTDAVYLRLGGGVLLFFPSNLEGMLVRAIPFIIAGLAVALGFKAGLFNIGAEGQLYAGGILAVWIGFSPIFDGLPIFIRLPLVIVGGITGGALWGAIPGALKAYTGAHEVITTIMLNYVAIRAVDWIIKTTDPLLLRDVNASTPRTPFLDASARLPTFASISPLIFILAGVLIGGYLLWQRRNALRENPRLLIAPIFWGVFTALGGVFLSWVGQRGSLHIGLIIMILAVWFTDWFLNRTTLGFELRTVGTNPDAARYAGMSVRRNIVFAMALSGAIAGLAGTIEISGVQFNMQPEFFAGLGFDAIAVALLARTNPRNMIPAGLLWGSLLAGAGLMQVRADISIDLVKIIQALIIMFIAADTIIRYIWRIPEGGDQTVSTFTKGWGG